MSDENYDDLLYEDDDDDVMPEGYETIEMKAKRTTALLQAIAANPNAFAGLERKERSPSYMERILESNWGKPEDDA